MRARANSVYDNCDFCGKRFTPYNRKHRFCTDTCRVNGHREKHAANKPPFKPPQSEWMRWCQTLTVPTGLRQGHPLKIEDWQRQFFEALDNRDFKELGLSCPRKQGKTGMLAAFLLANLVGPLNSPNWECVCCSLTAELAKSLKKQITQIAEASGLADKIRVLHGPGPGSIKGQNGTLVRFIAAGRAGAHSLGCNLAIIDEGGLFEERDRDLWESMITSLGTTNGRLIVISVRGFSAMFNEMEARKDDPSVFWLEFKADGDADLMDEAQWHKANPALGTIKSLDDMRAMAHRAAVTPSVQASFRTLHLNLPGRDDAEMVCSPTDWKRLVVNTLPPRDAVVVVGVDLGESASMTAGVVYSPLSGRLEALGCFPDEPGLLERGQGDGCGGLYELMADRGELVTFPGRTTDIKAFIRSLAALIGDSQVGVMLADRFKQERVIEVMTELDLGWPVQWRGMGFRDGNADLDDAQDEIIQGRPNLTENLMLESAIAESRIIRDPAGNKKLNRAHRRGRIDALAAMIFAVAAGRRLRPQLETRREPKVSFL